MEIGDEKKLWLGELDLMLVWGYSGFRMYNTTELGTSGIPICLLFAPILIPTLHSSMIRDPWTVNSGFRRNSVGIPE